MRINNQLYFSRITHKGDVQAQYLAICNQTWWNKRNILIKEGHSPAFKLFVGNHFHNNWKISVCKIQWFRKHFSLSSLAFIFCWKSSLTNSLPGTFMLLTSWFPGSVQAVISTCLLAQLLAGWFYNFSKTELAVSPLLPVFRLSSANDAVYLSAWNDKQTWEWYQYLHRTVDKRAENVLNT